MPPPDMGATSSRGAKNQVRIRGPKPDSSIQAGSMDNLEVALTAQIGRCLGDRRPYVVYSEFIFAAHVYLPVPSMPDEWKESLGGAGTETVGVHVANAVSQIEDAKTKLRRQRAVARAILDVIQKVDGFNNFEKEAWDTKHTDGYRFKFLCRDSFQNKDRAQNRARSSNASLVDFQLPSGEQSPNSRDSKDIGRLPTYDCKGSIFVKFSASQRMIDIVYQHFPLHRDPQPSPKKSRDGADDAMEIDSTVEAPAQPTTDPAYNTVAYETPGTLPRIPYDVGDDSGLRVKRRKKSAKMRKESEDSVFDDESSMNGIDTPGELPQPVYYRRDNSASPPRDLDWPLYPDDKDFNRPSVVTRVPGLSAQFKQAVRQSYRTSSDDTGPYPHESKKERKKPGPKPKAPAVQKEPVRAATAEADADRPARRRTKTGCWTCRTRKLKCDENRPRCSQCARSRPPRDCSYPEESDAPGGYNSGEE